jgi:hypothetical protein
MRSVAVIVFAGVIASTLGGCATKYQEMGLSGGVTAEQMTADTFRIIAQGNAYTSSTTIQDYALLKAAETTKTMGGSHFVIISAQDATSVSVGQTPGTMQTNVVGSMAFSTYNPGTTYTIVKPGENAYVRVLRLRPGEQPPPGAFLADEIIRYVGARVSQKQSFTLPF